MAPISSPNNSASRWLLRGLVVGLLAVGCITLMANFWPIGADYFFGINRTSVRWLEGKTHLYDEEIALANQNGQDIGYYNAPWSLFILAPLALLPLNVGQAILTTSSIFGLLLCLRALQETRPIPF